MSDAAARWQRLQEIVQAALDRPADGRAAFLDQACGGDESLRREAASLIAQDDHASAFLATPLGALAAGAVTYSPGGSLTVDDSRDLTGTRLGDYEIRARLGAGGMGEVYRARDHALHRDVAIKVLPLAFATDVERLARFEREARLLASLNHPHIGAVYGLAGHSNLRGIVLELIEGETLESRLRLGPIPLTQTLSLAQQIARALDHAHQHGVMHRDLKPANIMLTKSGAKLLDFGLAKWGASHTGYSPSPGSSSVRPEGVDSVTSEGTILGTLHYMAPEQLEGKKVDARADVFAFGAVLYEMLTGRRAFDGGSAAAVMASVLNTEPAALDTVKRLASPALERLVRKCLAKDPDNRWQSVRDLADELKWISDESALPRPSLDQGGNRPWSRRLVALTAATAVLALVAWTGWRAGSANVAPAARPVVRFPALASAAGRIVGFDISADGTRLVYGTAGRLYLRQLDQPNDAPIPGTEGGAGPLFSPDGQWVAFFSNDRLMKVNVQAASTPILLWDEVIRWLTNNSEWLDDGTIVVARPEEGLVRVSAEGGAPQALTSLTETPPEFDHHSPSMLPDGKTVMFSLHDTTGFRIVAQDLATGERKVLASAFDAHYSPTGHLVFARQRTILAVPFDLRRLEVTGPPVNMVENVAADDFNGYGGYRLSKSGTLVFRPAPSIAGRTLVFVDRKGNATSVPIAPRALSSPIISPDGRRLAFAVADRGRRDLFTYEFATEKLARVTTEGDNWSPIWTRDGKRLTFTSTRSGSPGLFLQSVDGTAAEFLVAGDVELRPGGWLADGRLVYSDGGTGPAGSSLFLLSMDGKRQPSPLLHGQGEQYHPRVSPDGRWLAYVSTEARRAEVFVTEFPDFERRHQVSIDGGGDVQWSHNGRELWYSFASRIFSVSIDTGPRFTPGRAREVQARNYPLGRDISYDVTADDRLVMVKPDPEELASLGLSVVLNWADELAKRVPTGQ